MTRRALGLKCGCFGPSGRTAAEVLAAPKALSAPSKEARAIEPRPMPHRWRNQRRAISLDRSFWSSSVKLDFAFMAGSIYKTPKYPNTQIPKHPNTQAPKEILEHYFAFVDGAAFHFRYNEQKIKWSCFASIHSLRASGFRSSSAVATMRRKNFVSLASFLQVPMLFLKSFRETPSSASQ